MAHWRQGTAFARVPAPHYQFVGSNVVDDLRERFAVVLFRIFYLPANLTRSFTFPDHRHIGWRQVPVGRSRWHVESGHVLLLMTGFALLSVFTFAVSATFHILSVNMAIVALAWEVAIGMTVKTARMFEDGTDGDEKLPCTRIVLLENGVGNERAGGRGQH